jgi:putative CocE/NonD family hydrolase
MKIPVLVLSGVLMSSFSMGFPEQCPGEDEISSPKYDVLMEMNLMVPMRDGIKLATDIYRPDAKGKYPVILVRTPYGSESTQYSDRGRYFAGRGYVFAVQDCRGKYDSEGEWYGKRSETDDGSDTIDWLASREWSSGNVGMWGASYLGLVQWQVAPVQNPHLKALVPIVAPVTLGSERVECNGAANSPLGLSWLVTTDGRVNQNVNAYNWNKIFWHLPLLDLPKLLGRKIPFWEKSLNLQNGFWEEYLQSAAEGRWNQKLELTKDFRTLYERINIPVLQISGWFDGSSESCWYNFRQINRYSRDPSVKRNQRVLMGPWTHFYTWSQYYTRSSRIGALDFGPNSLYDVDNLVLRFFDRWLKNIPNGVEEEPPLKIFVMGTNEWADAWEWPLPGTRFAPFYLHSAGEANSLLGDGHLSAEPPQSEPPDKYIYDPSHPTPALTTGENMALAASGPEDTRTIEERADVLVYTSDYLKTDTVVIGPVSAVLYVTSSAPETEFIVRLQDVHPDGSSYPVYVTYAGAFNTRCLKRIESGPPLDKILKCEFELPPTSQVFLKGHKIRVEICSSAFPLFRNLNTGGNFALETKWNIARQTIFHDKDHPSHVLLPIVPKAD